MFSDPNNKFCVRFSFEDLKRV